MSRGPLFVAWTMRGCVIRAFGVPLSPSPRTFSMGRAARGREGEAPHLVLSISIALITTVLKRWWPLLDG